MGILSRLGEFRREVWNGPPDLAWSVKLEWRLVAIRWLVMLFMGALLPFLILPPLQLIAAYVTIGIAAIYNVIVGRLLHSRPRLLVSGYPTALCDCAFSVAAVIIDGGFTTSLYYFLFATTIAAGIRYGYGPVTATVLLFVASDAIETFLQGRLVDSSFALRSGFLIITGVLAVQLHEQAVQAEAALQDRLREANLLNEATALLGASLELETVLQSIVRAACYFSGSPVGVLQPSDDLIDQRHNRYQRARPTNAPLSATVLREARVRDYPMVYCPEPGWLPYRDELQRACEDALRAEKDTRSGDRLLRTVELPSGKPALVLVLTRASEPIPLGAVALIASSDRSTPRLARDLVSSFAERVTLAIENALLFRTLEGRTDDLQQAYADLAIAHQELLRMDEMKTNFLSSVSHEFRTPLSSIRSFSELLLSYDDPSVRREFLEIINLESERLTRMVTDVLDITKIEAGKMTWIMEEVDLTSLLQDSVKLYRPMIERQNLSLSVEIDDDLPAIYGDRDRLKQVIENLLNNALKFTQHGGFRVVARVVDGEARVAISDTGMGIAAADQERIFQKFQQVGESLTEQPRGTGLGLSICREIIEHHQGRIWVESELGVGSTFIFALKINRRPGGSDGIGFDPADEPTPAAVSSS